MIIEEQDMIVGDIPMRRIKIGQRPSLFSSPLPALFIQKGGKEGRGGGFAPYHALAIAVSLYNIYIEG